MIYIFVCVCFWVLVCLHIFVYLFFIVCFVVDFCIGCFTFLISISFALFFKELHTKQNLLHPTITKMLDFAIWLVS